MTILIINLGAYKLTSFGGLMYLPIAGHLPVEGLDAVEGWMKLEEVQTTPAEMAKLALIRAALHTAEASQL